MFQKYKYRTYAAQTRTGIHFELQSWKSIEVYYMMRNHHPLQNQRLSNQGINDGNPYFRCNQGPETFSCTVRLLAAVS